MHSPRLLLFTVLLLASGFGAPSLLANDEAIPKVPEPGTVILLTAGAFFLTVLTRRRANH